MASSFSALCAGQSPSCFSSLIASPLSSSASVSPSTATKLVVSASTSALDSPLQLCSSADRLLLSPSSITSTPTQALRAGAGFTPSAAVRGILRMTLSAATSMGSSPDPRPSPASATRSGRLPTKRGVTFVEEPMVHEYDLPSDESIRSHSIHELRRPDSTLGQMGGNDGEGASAPQASSPAECATEGATARRSRPRQPLRKVERRSKTKQRQSKYDYSKWVGGRAPPYNSNSSHTHTDASTPSAPALTSAGAPASNGSASGGSNSTAASTAMRAASAASAGSHRASRLILAALSGASTITGLAPHLPGSTMAWRKPTETTTITSSSSASSHSSSLQSDMPVPAASPTRTTSMGCPDSPTTNGSLSATRCNADASTLTETSSSSASHAYPGSPPGRCSNSGGGIIARVPGAASSVISPPEHSGVTSPTSPGDRSEDYASAFLRRRKLAKRPATAAGSMAPPSPSPRMSASLACLGMEVVQSYTLGCGGSESERGEVVPYRTPNSVVATNTSTSTRGGHALPVINDVAEARDSEGGAETRPQSNADAAVTRRSEMRLRETCFDSYPRSAADTCSESILDVDVEVEVEVGAEVESDGNADGGGGDSGDGDESAVCEDSGSEEREEGGSGEDDPPCDDVFTTQPVDLPAVNMPATAPPPQSVESTAFADALNEVGLGPAHTFSDADQSERTPSLKPTSCDAAATTHANAAPGVSLNAPLATSASSLPTAVAALESVDPSLVHEADNLSPPPVRLMTSLAHLSSQGRSSAHRPAPSASVSALQRLSSPCTRLDFTSGFAAPTGARTNSNCSTYVPQLAAGTCMKLSGSPTPALLLPPNTKPVRSPPSSTGMTCVLQRLSSPPSSSPPSPSLTPTHNEGMLSPSIAQSAAPITLTTATATPGAAATATGAVNEVSRHMSGGVAASPSTHTPSVVAATPAPTTAPTTTSKGDDDGGSGPSHLRVGDRVFVAMSMSTVYLGAVVALDTETGQALVSYDEYPQSRDEWRPLSSLTKLLLYGVRRTRTRTTPASATSSASSQSQTSPNTTPTLSARKRSRIAGAVVEGGDARAGGSGSGSGSGGSSQRAKRARVHHEQDHEHVEVSESTSEGMEPEERGTHGLPLHPSDSTSSALSVMSNHTPVLSNRRQSQPGIECFGSGGAIPVCFSSGGARERHDTATRLTESTHTASPDAPSAPTSQLQTTSASCIDECMAGSGAATREGDADSCSPSGSVGGNSGSGSATSGLRPRRAAADPKRQQAYSKMWSFLGNTGSTMLSEEIKRTIGLE